MDVPRVSLRVGRPFEVERGLGGFEYNVVPGLGVGTVMNVFGFGYLFLTVVDVVLVMLSAPEWLVLGTAGLACVSTGLLLVVAVAFQIYSKVSLGVRLEADRDLVRLGRQVFGWESVRSVETDLASRMDDGSRRACVVLGLDEGFLAVPMRNIQAAEELAEKLDFLHRNAAGTPEDVPDALRSLGRSRVRENDR